jgi:hypothetical protein
MGIPFHSNEAIDGFNEFAYVDRALIGLNMTVAYAAGAAGATVATPVTFPASADMPANYAVFVDASAGGSGASVFFWVTNKTSTGFTLNAGPQTASTGVVAAGSVNLLIVA